MMTRIHSLLATIAAALFVFNAHAAKLPEKLRVLSCDLALQNPAGDAAQELRRLLDKSDPDIIFLQHAGDWETCDRICKLRPGLRVLTCSAFQAVNGAAPQVAILARDKAILSWVEETSAGQGFAFALIQAGPRKLGIFSVQGAATDRVLAEVKKVQQFANNRPDSFVLAGAGLSKIALTDGGFETVASDAKVQTAEFWASNAGFLSRPRSIAVAGLSQPIVISDVDTASSFSSKFAYQTALLFPGENPAPVPAVVVQPLTVSHVKPIAIGGGVLIIVLTVLFFTRRNRTTSLQVLAKSDTDQETRANLVTWIKSAFMQRLVSQHQQMIADESEATRRTLAIEEKISHLQSALQERISAYETRIERLEAELSAATNENRSLIRDQIDLLKEKVAKAKEEFSFRRN